MQNILPVNFPVLLHSCHAGSLALVAGDADRQGDWNQHTPSRFPSARHSSEERARAGKHSLLFLPRVRHSVLCSWMCRWQVRPGLTTQSSSLCSDQLSKELSAAVLIFPALVYPSNYKIRRLLFICVRQPSVFFVIIRKTTDCPSI